jgi:hypothetical protein
MTWQKFYEIYDLYGDDEEAWKPYLDTSKKEATEVATSIGFADIISWLKTADLSKVEEGINSVQRVIDVFQEMTSNKDNDTKTTTYKPRPLYKHFED